MLFQIAETTFISSACFGVGPAEDVLDFATDDPHQRTLKWTPKHGDSFLAHAVTLPEEEISFKDGDVTLAGSLLLPSTPGPYPAVVFVHGSGPSSRNDYRLIASYFAANGVAALIFDKRGVGKSSGNWAASGFDELAGDALAAIETLKTRADIQPRNIGLCGMSQAGWIMPLAASRSPDVAFLISLSGPGVSPEEQGAYMVEHRVRQRIFLMRMSQKHWRFIVWIHSVRDPDQGGKNSTQPLHRPGKNRGSIPILFRKIPRPNDSGRQSVTMTLFQFCKKFDVLFWPCWVEWILWSLRKKVPPSGKTRSPRQKTPLQPSKYGPTPIMALLIRSWGYRVPNSSRFSGTGCANTSVKSPELGHEHRIGPKINPLFCFALQLKRECTF